MCSPSPRRAFFPGIAGSRAFYAGLVGLALAALTGCGSSASSLGPATTGAGAGGSLGTTGSASSSSGGVGGAEAQPPLLATDIAVGTTHSCALLTSGEVACWGDGSSGQLGDGMSGTGYGRAMAAKVPGLTGVKAIRAGGATTCAILADHVMCWGDGTYGQLGNGTAQAGYFESSPVQAAVIASVRSLSISESCACAISSVDGTAFCWGRNSATGWLGFNNSPDCGPYPTSMNAVETPCQKMPAAVPNLAQGAVVSTSGDHSCATLSTGALSCWGVDTFGQLGDGLAGAHDPAPVAAQITAPVKAVAAGNAFTCAVSGPTRTVYCWGDNAYGQLGVGAAGLESRSTPGPLGLAGVVDIDASDSAACAVLDDGSVRCWGAVSGLFADTATTMTPIPTPQEIVGVAGASLVRTSGAHACALLADHTVTCWGADEAGQLGDGLLQTGGYTPTAVLSPE